MYKDSEPANQPHDSPSEEVEKPETPKVIYHPKLLHTVSSRQSERELREVAKLTCPLTLYIGNLPKSW